MKRLGMVVSVLVSTMLLGLAPATAQDGHDKSPAASSDHSKTTYKKRKLGTLLGGRPERKAVVGGHVVKYVWKTDYPKKTVIKRDASSCKSMTLTVAYRQEYSGSYTKLKVIREGKNPRTWVVEGGTTKTVSFKLKVGKFFQVKFGTPGYVEGVVFANGSAHCSTTDGRLS